MTGAWTGCGRGEDRKAASPVLYRRTVTPEIAVGPLLASHLVGGISVSMPPRAPGNAGSWRHTAARRGLSRSTPVTTEVAPFFVLLLLLLLRAASEVSAARPSTPPPPPEWPFSRRSRHPRPPRPPQAPRAARATPPTAKTTTRAPPRCVVRTHGRRPGGAAKATRSLLDRTIGSDRAAACGHARRPIGATAARKEHKRDARHSGFPPCPPALLPPCSRTQDLSATAHRQGELRQAPRRCA